MDDPADISRSGLLKADLAITRASLDSREEYFNRCILWRVEKVDLNSSKSLDAEMDSSFIWKSFQLNRYYAIQF